MLVLIGESGVGKTTAEKVLELRGFVRAISLTSRKPRVGEREGVDYYYSTEEAIEAMDANGELGEHIKYNGNHYALHKSECRDECIVSVEPTGLAQLMDKKDLDLYVIYLKASEKVRMGRMLARGDKQESVEQRIANDRIVFKGIANKVDIVVDTGTMSIEEVADYIENSYNNR